MWGIYQRRQLFTSQLLATTNTWKSLFMHRCNRCYCVGGWKGFPGDCEMKMPLQTASNTEYTFTFNLLHDAPCQKQNARTTFAESFAPIPRLMRLICTSHGLFSQGYNNDGDEITLDMSSALFLGLTYVVRFLKGF